MDSIARKQFRKTELYPFMVGQRFTTMDYIEACRDRYLLNKGVHLQIVQLSGTDIKCNVLLGPCVMEALNSR